MTTVIDVEQDQVREKCINSMEERLKMYAEEYTESDVHACRGKQTVLEHAGGEEYSQ